MSGRRLTPLRAADDAPSDDARIAEDSSIVARAPDALQRAAHALLWRRRHANTPPRTGARAWRARSAAARLRLRAARTAPGSHRGAHAGGRNNPWRQSGARPRADRAGLRRSLPARSRARSRRRVGDRGGRGACAGPRAPRPRAGAAPDHHDPYRPAATAPGSGSRGPSRGVCRASKNSACSRRCTRPMRRCGQPIGPWPTRWAGRCTAMVLPTARRPENEPESAACAGERRRHARPANHDRGGNDA